MNLEGQKEVLGLWVAQTEGAKFWLQVLTEIQNRGVKDIFIACVDGLKGFPEAIEAVYPRTEVQLCIVHLVRASLNYVPWKLRKAAAADLRLIYRAATVAEAEQHLAELEAKWKAYVFDGATRTLRYVNAGHNPPVVLRHDGSVRWLEPCGAPIGMFSDSNYAESLLQLSPGDLVIAYTDGIIEATNPAGEEWGVQGLLKATAAFRLRCAENAESLVGLIFNCMDEFSRSCHRDDATLAILRVV